MPLQPLLLLSALVSVPIMLGVKPYVLKKRHDARHSHGVRPRLKSSRAAPLIRKFKFMYRTRLCASGHIRAPARGTVICSQRQRRSRWCLGWQGVSYGRLEEEEDDAEAQEDGGGHGGHGAARCPPPSRRD